VSRPEELYKELQRAQEVQEVLLLAGRKQIKASSTKVASDPLLW